MRSRVRIAGFLFALCALVGPDRPAGAADRARRIAIMPFQNLSGVKDLDSIGTGIAETLITELGRIPELTLVERSRLNDAQKEIKLGQSGAVENATAQKMGKFLGADGVVVGSYQRVGNTLRISARVIDVQTAQVRESTRVDGPPDDLLNLQDQLAAKLLETMKGTLAAADRRRLGASPSSSVAALRAFSDGVAYFKLDLFPDAIASFGKALALDPNYVDAQYYEGKVYEKLKRWDDAIAAFKRTLPTLPRGPVEHTVKWSWDAPFDTASTRTAAFATLDPAAATTQNLLSPDAVVRARKRIVYAETAGAKTVFTIVDPVERRSNRLEVPEGGSMFGLALASERVVALPVPTASSLLGGTMRLYGVSAADGTLLWQKDLETQRGLSLVGFAGETFWIYSPGAQQLVGLDEMTLREKWRRDNLALDLAFPTVRPGAAGGAPLAIARSTPERKLHAIRTSDGVDAWTVDLQSDQSFLLAADRAVVVLEPDGRVLAVDGESGKPLLDIRLKQASRMKGFGVLGSLVTVPALVHDATLYVASDLNEIVAIDLSPGIAPARRQRWKTPPQRPIREIRAAGERVYATTDAGELLVVDAQSGIVAAAKVGSQPLDLDYAGDDLVVVSSPEAVYGLKPENGAREWEFRAPARTKRPVYFKGTLLVETSGTGRLIALDADTGGVLWQFTTPLADNTIGDLGASAPKVMFGDDSVFIMTPWGVSEYGVNRSASQGTSNKEALTDLAAAYVEKGDLDEAARFADLVGREFDPSYPPLWRVRSRIAQARGKPADALHQLLTYVDLVGRESKAGQEVLADLRRTRGLLWTAEVGASFWGPLLADRKLVAHNFEQVLAVDPASGKTLWRVKGDRIFERVYDPLSRRLFYAETLARDRRTAVISTIEVANGERKEFGRVALPSDITGFITAFAAGRLYFVGYAIGLDVQPQQIHVRVGAFDGASGRRLWERPAGLTLVQAMMLQNYGALFFPLGDSLVCSIGREVLVMRGDDGTVRAEFTADSDPRGLYLLTDQGRDPDMVYFGTVSTTVNGYSLSAKQLVVQTNVPDAADSWFAFDNITHDGMMYDKGPDGRVFAFDVRKDTPDASRLKWRTDPERDGRFVGVRFVGNDLYATRTDNTLVRLDTQTGRIVSEYPLIWLGNAVENGDRQYGFTADGLAFALQLKPVSR